MKYSMIKINGGIMSYLTAPDLPPNNGANVNGIRDYLFWQQSMKIFPVKDGDKAEIWSYIEENKVADSGGYSIPYNFMEIYKEEGKEFARKNTKVIFDSANKVIAVSHVCPVCTEKYSVELEKNDQVRMPFCSKCNEVLAMIILNERVSKSLTPVHDERTEFKTITVNNQTTL